jgi:hypothetical protein
VKIGAENKKELIIMACLLAVAIPLIIYTVYNMSSGGASAAAPASTTSRPQSRSGVLNVAQNNLDPTLHKEILENSRKVKYEAGGRNIFTMQADPVPTPNANIRVVATPTPVPTPTPFPPIPLKFFGSQNKPNEPRRVFLSEGDAASGTVFVAKQGDIVDRRYRVVQINTATVVIEDVLTGNKQTIPLTAR